MADETNESKETQQAGSEKNEDGTDIKPGAAPQVDAEAIGKVVESRLDAWLQQKQDEEQQQQQVAPTENQGPQPSDNPIARAVDPYVQPQLQASKIESMDAKDAALFYANTDEAKPYYQEIEKMADNMKRQGTPFSRKSLWAFYKGEHLDEFVEKRMKQKAKETEEAAHAQTVGNAPTPTSSQVKPVDNNASDEDLEKAVDNIQF